MLNGIAAAHDAMIKLGQGHIVNVSSVLGTGVVNSEAVAGILGANVPAYMGKFAASASGALSPEV